MIQIPEGLDPEQKVQFLSSAISSSTDPVEAMELTTALNAALLERKIFIDQKTTAEYLAIAEADPDARK